MIDPRQEKALEDQIAENLQKAFRERAEESVPDRFLDLLAQLREQDEADDE